MSIQIVTDSTAYLTKDEIEKYNIKVVELQISFQGEERLEGFPGEFEDFFEKLKESKDFPVTSQPPPGGFLKVFKEALEEDREVLAITISSKLSGTYNSAVLASETLDPSKITVIDSLTTVANLKHMVIEAQEMALKGKSREDILEYVEDQKTRMGIYLTVETLDYLQKSGRLSKTQALIGSILNVKPILKLEDGVIEAVGKVRGKRKAIEAMIKDIPEEAKAVYIPHIYNEKEARKMKEVLQKKLPGIKIELAVLGPVIGSHIGPKGMGACFIW